jgi:hypothetical protein
VKFKCKNIDMKNELVGTVNSTENIEVPQKVKNKTTL